MIIKALEKAIKTKEEKQWDRTYWAFDIHETMIVPNWTDKELPTKFYPYAKETMQLISQQEDIVRILYTCSHPHEIELYLEYFKKFDIHFNYVNENPEVQNGSYGFYDYKPYFNVLFEDKSGFDCHSDWELVYAFIKEWKR
ncbi:MAG: hypothetical protein AAFN93_13085 [Bacteroidota bacterium]